MEMHRGTYELEVLGGTDGVSRRGILGMRPCPHDELVLRDGGGLPGLELRREEVGEAEPALVVETVGPGVGTGRKLAVLRADVVRLAEVIPGDDLDKGDLVAVRDYVLPGETQRCSSPSKMKFLLNVSAPKCGENQGATAAMYVCALPWTFARLLMCALSVSKEPINFWRAASPLASMLLRSTPGRSVAAALTLRSRGQPELN